LLREADFDTVNVTGGSGDGGIDGMDVYRLGLVSFPVFFLVQAIPGQRRGGGRQRLSWGDGRAR
jgi:restriction system protein